MKYDGLKCYVQNWKKIDGIKPKNETEFIEGFINLISTLEDDRDISFDGEGAYFGKQITLSYGSGVWCGDKDLSFEIAYSPAKISVYRADNEGFWTPEYLSIDNSHERYYEVTKPFYHLLWRVFGL